MFAIGITSNIDAAQLKAISNPPHELGRNYVTTPDFTTLSQVLDRLINATCTEDKPDLPGRQMLLLARPYPLLLKILFNSSLGLSNIKVFSKDTGRKPVPTEA